MLVTYGSTANIYTCTPIIQNTVYTLVWLDTVNIYWWWCINVCRVEVLPRGIMLLVQLIITTATAITVTIHDHSDNNNDTTDNNCTDNNNSAEGKWLPKLCRAVRRHRFRCTRACSLHTHHFYRNSCSATFEFFELESFFSGMSLFKLAVLLQQEQALYQWRNMWNMLCLSRWHNKSTE